MGTVDQFSNHLQFLGYEVSTVKEDVVKAIHSVRPNLFLRAFRGGILLTSIFGCSDNAKKNRAGYLDFINFMNQKATVTRFYADKDSDFFMEAWFSGTYDRADFGNFMSLWDEDIDRLATSEASKFLK